MRFILASASPRRNELLKQIGIEVDIEKSNYQECESIDYRTLVKVNTEGKLLEVVNRILPKEDVVIAADTVVVLDGKVFGKPKNAANAKMMLRELSGKKHCVSTGIAIYYKGEIRYNYNDTDVFMNSITDEEIDSYVESGEPLDKAGAYAIQGKASVFVNKIEGCYSNVVGLSLPLLYKMLQELGITISFE